MALKDAWRALWTKGEKSSPPLPKYGSSWGTFTGQADIMPLGFQPASSVNFEREVGPVWLSSLASVPINWLGRNFPEAPPVLMVKGPDGVEKTNHDHEILTLLANPNDYYSGDDLWSQSVLSGISNGNAYWLKERTTSGKVVHLWHIPHCPACPHDGGSPSPSKTEGRQP